jgi:hypothetical protein
MMSFEEQVHLNSGSLPFDRIEISQLRQLELAAIAQAVIFVFATWSGDSLQSFRLLCDEMAKNPAANFPIIVIDADGFDFEAFEKVFGESPQGKGETFWIRSGQIIGRDNGYTYESFAKLSDRIASLNSASGTDNV